MDNISNVEKYMDIYKELKFEEQNIHKGLAFEIFKIYTYSYRSVYNTSNIEQ